MSAGPNLLAQSIILSTNSKKAGTLYNDLQIRIDLSAVKGSTGSYKISCFGF